MDIFEELELKWSYGYNASQVHFADDNTLVYGCGNSLTFVTLDGKHVRSHASEGTGVVNLAVSTKAGLIAYCESTLEPKIFMLHYPSCAVHAILEGGAKLEFSCITFSKDGKKLATLSGLPDFKLVIWDCQSGDKLCQANAESGGSEISFNPLNSIQLCLIGPHQICLYNLDQCGSDIVLSPFVIDLPDRLMQVGSMVSPRVSPAGLAKSTTEDVVKKKLERRSTKLDHDTTLHTPPDMQTLLYQDSYDDYMHKRSPVKPMSHCWNAQENVYIGCEHGQLLLVHFETGIVKILANPDIAIHEKGDIAPFVSSSSGVNTPSKTGHALLGEGDTSVLALSRRGLFAAGKNGLIYCFGLTDDLPLMDMVDISQPVVSLSWPSTYNRLAIGTRNGSILLAESTNLQGNTSLLSDHSCSDIIGIDVLGHGFEYCVSCRSTGRLEVWNISEAAMILKLDINLNTMCSSLCCPPSCDMAIVGTESGMLVVVSLTEVAKPTIVYQMSLHRNPLRFIRHDQHGNLMATVTDDGLIFLQDCRPSSQMAVLGYTEFSGIPLDVAIIREPEQSHIAVLAQVQDKTTVTLLLVPHHILDKGSSHDQEVYADTTKRLSKDFVKFQTIISAKALSSLTLVAENSAISLGCLEFSKCVLPQADGEDVGWELSPNECYSAGDLKSARAVLSFHRKWLGFGSADGQVELRLLKNPENKITVAPHCYQHGGCKFLTFSRDGQYLITAGDCGALTCWRLKFTNQGAAEKSAAMDYAQRYIYSQKSLQLIENAALNQMHPPSSEKTWLEASQDRAIKTEDEKYADIKAGLRKEINQLREKVLNMIASNEELPHIEQLARQEFILDTEEHMQMQADEDELILQVREQIELNNLASMFIRERIKAECWDEMAVKGLVVKAFNGRLEVSNYPLKTHCKTTMEKIRRVKALRNIEVAEIKIRQEVEGALRQSLQLLHMQHHETLDGDDEAGEMEERTKQQQNQELEKGNPEALLGSHAAQVGGDNELLYDQFNLHSSISKKHQILLLEDNVYLIKEIFNKEFNEVYRQKEMEIARIKEKNVRISKIIQQLNLDDTLVNPSLDEDETPDRLLSVENDEILVEKYISPEEQKILEVAEQEEAKRLAEMGDNPRERALDMMMGGRLEANVEEDLLKDLPRPDFLSKDPGEMSEDEIRLARDFEKKEMEFLEEREKLKKALEAELRKLQMSIAQGMEQFDERILKLFQLKIKTEMAVLQQELMILCLTRVMLSEEEVTEKDIRLNQLLEEYKAIKVQLGSVISSTKRMIEDVHEQYEQLVAEDRELDKSFKRDFADCEPYVDQLYKLFRKRPRGHRLKQGPSSDEMKVGPKSQNPFAVLRSPSGVGKKHTIEGTGDTDPMVELDDPSHMPEGLDYLVWERVVTYRRRKLSSEQKVKTMAFKLAEMNAYLSKRQAEDDHVQQQIQDTFKQLNRLQEDKMIFDLNLEIQFLLKQGQVEVDMGKFVPNFCDSVLVHRSCIEELNSHIKTLGEGKLHAMAECKDFKRGIRLLDWEHRKMRMEAEDLVEKAKDIQMLRVTKDLQQRLMEENVTSKDQNEIDTLEKTIELNQKMYKKSVRDSKKTLTKLQQEVNEKSVYNQNLDQQLIDCQVSVAEQQQVENLAGVPLSEANREQRMNDIVTRKQLVETIKLQDNQISVLRNELERLRMRAFPALVQID